MKIICVALVLVPFLGSCADQTKVMGNIHGAKAKECFRVVDQDGNPVGGAHFRGAFVLDGWNDYQRVEGVSNTNGEFVAEGKSKDRFHYRITKDGYYKTSGDILYLSTKASPAVVDGKWQPYGQQRDVVLKRQVKPARNVVPNVSLRLSISIPECDKWMGFDLEKFDWVNPNGKGKHEDVLIKFGQRITDKWYDFTYRMDVCFTNNLFAGAIIKKKDAWSELETEHCANTNANYVSEFHFIQESRGDGKKIYNLLDADSYMIFRTRTSIDEQGRLKEAHYGAIHGGWFPDKNRMDIQDVCFNPIPNDPNIEDGHLLRELLRIRRRD